MEQAIRRDFSRSKRSGQALIVAVLLMLFAAVLSATFVAVVSQNLKQTGTNSEESEVQRALQAGLRYARLQISNNGLSWRPKNDAPPPQPDDSTFSFYYDGIDRARNWATTNVAANDARFHSDGFVRFPDPRSATSSETLPFMLKVERIENGDADNINNARSGDLRISVIGRSSRNLNMWAERVIYQEGAARNPLTSTLRSVSNWDFENRVVPWARIARVSGTTLTLEKGAGEFPSGGNIYVLIGDTTSSRGVRGAVVESYASSTRSLKLAASVVPAPQVGERVEISAALGWQHAIDFDNNLALDVARESVIWNMSAENNASSGGVRVNGGLLMFGSTRADLRSSQSASNAPATIRASGLVQMATAPLSTSLSSATLNGEYSNGSVANAALLGSDNRDFPWAQSGVSASDKAQLVDDGANRIAGVPAPTRNVEAFEPPDLESGGAQNRYRLLSEYSKSAVPNDATNAALYGYGEGMYLNNPQDREKVSQNGKLREMTQDELRLLWTSHDPSSPSFLRLGTPVSRTSTSGSGRSLEEQHLRGWIGPDEFRGRGALVEINDDNTLTITLDSRDDGLAFSLGTAPHKAWRNSSGQLLGDANAGGVYRQTFAWPKNGVVFAEGNLRVRGTASNPPRSLTFVSQNNIYIEGSLNAGTRKIALLARRNVVLNPTRVLERPDEQTLLRRAISRFPATELHVFDASGFRKGDWIFVDNPTSKTEQDVCVEGIDTTNNIIYLNVTTPLTSTKTQEALRSVRIKSDPIQSTGAPFNRYNRLERFGHVLQRRFKGESNGEVRLALRHSAQRLPTLRVPYFSGLNSPSSTRVGHKIASNNATSLLYTNEKTLSVFDDANDLDSWGIGRLFPPRTKPTQYDLNWIADNGISREEFGRLRARVVPNWRYADPTTPLILGGHGTVPTKEGEAQVPPFYFLTSVGNRYDLSSPVVNVWPYRQNVKLRGASGFDIPMATSVITTLNGRFSNVGTPGIRGDVWNEATHDWERVGQFGFNPIHGAATPGTASTDETEDVATVDSSFYAPYISSPSVPQWCLNDSRVLDVAQNGVNNVAFRFNNRRVDGDTTVDQYFTADTTVDGPHLPYYNLSRLKLENLGFNSSREIETLSPGATIEVRAYVYAQQGSWWVLPSDFFDSTARNNSDQNRDGIPSRDVMAPRGEQIAGLRWARQNTKISFIGAISERHTPVVNTVGSVNGVVADWTNKWANVALTAANFGEFYSDNASVAAGNYNAISYRFDEDVAAGLFDEDDGLHIPLPPARGASQQ